MVNFAESEGVNAQNTLQLHAVSFDKLGLHWSASLQSSVEMVANAAQGMLLLWSLPRMLGGQVMLMMLAKSANARLKLKPFSKKISTTSVLSVSSCPLRRKACRGKVPGLEVPLRGFALPGPAMQTASLSQSGKDLTCKCGREH